MSDRAAQGGRWLCSLAEVETDGARGFCVDDLEVIVVTDEGRHHAFVNRCPHKGTTLDWAPGKLTSADGQYLQCATHGARFERRTGHCVSGPCAGQRLVPLRLCAAMGDLFLVAGESP